MSISRRCRRRCHDRKATALPARVRTTGGPSRNRATAMPTGPRAMTTAATGEKTAQELHESRVETLRVRCDAVILSDDRDWVQLSTPTPSRKPDRPVNRRWVFLRVIAAAV